MGKQGHFFRQCVNRLLNRISRTRTSQVNISVTLSMEISFYYSTPSFPELILLLCSSELSVYSILSKKIITKSLLCEYLHYHNVPAGNSTKTELIEKMISLWKARHQSPTVTDSVQAAKVTINIVNNHITNTTVLQSTDQQPSHLQRLAEEFTSWLFERINNGSLVESDLWSDVTGAIRLIDSAGNTEDLQARGCTQVHKSFADLRTGLQFQLVPNICPVGVQGKMNSYGMVMIASCGCVYRSGVFVGVFEAAFGLLRDSTSSEVWKLKHSKLQIKSVATGQQTIPQLEYCDSLKDILALPETDELQLSCLSSN